MATLVTTTSLYVPGDKVLFRDAVNDSACPGLSVNGDGVDEVMDVEFATCAPVFTL